jgi:hypothetical protein
MALNTVFIKGLKLNEDYALHIVKPLIDRHYPELNYALGLVGYGSDVLGFDTEISMDHNWGPRLVLFLEDNRYDELYEELDELFKFQLPVSFQGFPTNFTHPSTDSTQSMEAIEKNPVNHLIQITTVSRFVEASLGFDMYHELTLKDWLYFSEQGLLELTEGKIFFDSIGTITQIRSTMKRFPKDILRIKLASLWERIANEEAFVGRCLDTGDDIGLRLITARIINTLMKICFYLEERFIPYSKWFGSAFDTLLIAKEIKASFMSCLTMKEADKIPRALADLYTLVVNYQNSKSLTEVIDSNVQYYYSRPYTVIFANRIVDALIDSIENQEIKLYDYRLIGLEQKVDGMDFTDQSGLLKSVLEVETIAEKIQLNIETVKELGQLRSNYVNQVL